MLTAIQAAGSRGQNFTFIQAIYGNFRIEINLRFTYDII